VEIFRIGEKNGKAVKIIPNNIKQL